MGRWGPDEAIDNPRMRFRELGADEVGTTLIETRNQISQLSQLVSPPRFHQCRLLDSSARSDTVNVWVIPRLLKETAFEWRRSSATIRRGVGLLHPVFPGAALGGHHRHCRPRVRAGHGFCRAHPANRNLHRAGWGGVIQATIENTSRRSALPLRSSVWRLCCSAPRSCSVSFGTPSIQSGKWQHSRSVAWRSDSSGIAS